MARTRWYLLSNYGAVLVFLASSSGATIREVAAEVGISERRAAGIIRELSDETMIRIHKRGSRNEYEILGAAHFPHRFLAHLPIRVLLDAMVAALREHQPPAAAESADPPTLRPVR